MNASVGFAKVWTDEPRGCDGRVEEEFLGGVVLINWTLVMFAQEFEEARPLVLPNGRRAVAFDNDFITATFASQLAK